MKKVYSLVISVFFFAATLTIATNSSASCQKEVLPSTGATSASGVAPSVKFTNTRSVYLITPEEMAIAGIYSGQTISLIGLNFQTGSGFIANGPCKIYVQSTTDETNTKSTDWPTIIADMSLVWNSNVTLPSGAGICQLPVNTFTYNGDGLYVAYDWGCYTGTLSILPVLRCNNNLPGGCLYAENTGACTTLTTLSSSDNRPQTYFYTTNEVSNDVGVDLIYTLGSMALNNTADHIIQARVTNYSNTTATGKTVTLDITGANTFTSTVTIPSLSFCASATVSFDAFTPTNTGTNTITVSVASDANNGNNSKTISQAVTDADINYADYFISPMEYILGSENSTGATAAKFNTAIDADIGSVSADFLIADINYRVAVAADDGTGKPGSTIYEDASDRLTVQGLNVVAIDPVVNISAGSFFIIIEQTGTDNLQLQGSIESPVRSGSFFSQTPLYIGAWNDFSSGTPILARPNIGVTFCTQQTFYGDADEDGYGNPNATTSACAAPSGYVPDNTDCNDANEFINPGVSEICNQLDDNCNGQIDEGLSQTVYYQDNDGDGYGDFELPYSSCSNPGNGYSINYGDCDEANPSIYPGATEVCNQVDDNCNGQIDEGLSQTIYYHDSDGDGYGDFELPYSSCANPGNGYSINYGDCDETNPSINPGATEVCNSVDDNCNGQVDEGNVCDQDGDGYTVAQGDCNDADQFIHPGAIETCGNGIDDNCDGNVDSDCDGDSDGYTVLNGDCNDSNPNIYPGAFEVCNGVDDNCDGIIDGTSYCDDDGDGYAEIDGDCNDSDPNINPGASEVCGNVIDDNCDGYVDNGCDQDGDGFTVADGDCDDSNPSVYPGATEICNSIDDNCNNQVDEGFTLNWYADADGDGYGNPDYLITTCTPPPYYVSNADDCNDANEFVHPGGFELCNGIDDNCNGEIDEGLTLLFFYRDYDGDGYGNPYAPTTACTPPAGYVSDNTDCNDLNNQVYPGAVEVCNQSDDNCNGQVDEGLPQFNIYFDLDADGFGHLSAGMACAIPYGFSDNGDDCDDLNPAINPGAPELCNLIDDNCNGQIDEGLTASTYYFDYDQDGFGAGPGIPFCTNPGIGYSLHDGDCDDTDPNVNPFATEKCNYVDDDCDGVIDNGVTVPVWYPDADHDGFGDGTFPVPACTAPDGFIDNNGDCNDNDNQTYPGAPELCDLLDNNCNGLIDDGIPVTTYYVDEDGDGYGDENDPGVTTCADLAPEYSTNNGDCDDTDPLINPGATETCNNIDDDCDGWIDNNVEYTLYFYDGDLDGWGDVNDPGVLLCYDPGLSYSLLTGDCDDANASVYPFATEICNDVDDDCNGLIDDGLPFATFHPDADGDGYGDGSSSITACTQPTGYVTDGTDCDDANAAVHPGAVEIANGIDDNCNGQVDETSCSIPTGITTDDITSTSALFQWNVVADANKYRIVYKITGANALWSKVTDYTTQTSYPATGLLPSTQYTWQVTALCGATHSSWSAGLRFTTLAAKEGESLSANEGHVLQLVIYPNPTQGDFFIDLDLNEDVSGAAEIQLTNSIGQLLRSEKISVVDGMIHHQIHIGNNLPSGNYFVRVITGHSIVTGFIIYQE